MKLDLEEDQGVRHAMVRHLDHARKCRDYEITKWRDG